MSEQTGKPAEKTCGLVVPVYDPDEEQCIDYIEQLEAELGVDEILVVIDSPRTGFIEKIPSSVKKEVSGHRRGKGRAIKDGFELLETDYVAFVDSDGSIPMDSVRKILGRKTDVVVGSRRHPETAEIHHESRVQKFLGDVLVVLGQKIIGNNLHDYQCGIKLFRAEVWEDIEEGVVSDGFAWDLEAIYAAERKGYDVEEVPVDWFDTPHSTVSIIPDSLGFVKVLAEIGFDRLTGGKLR